jgi:hypothetical protein
VTVITLALVSLTSHAQDPLEPIWFLTVARDAVIGFTAFRPVSHQPPSYEDGGSHALSFDSYREVLMDHARDRNLVKSAWFIVIAIAVFSIASA